MSRWIRDEAQARPSRSARRGALYPALHRMERRGARVRVGDRRSPPPRQVLRLTRKGRSLLAAREAEWRRYVAVVGRILDAAKG
ncbi:MAG: helix-turn-helix transcriptional regulator [Gemmatimonadales bacterium]